MGFIKVTNQKYKGFPPRLVLINTKHIISVQPHILGFLHRFISVSLYKSVIKLNKGTPLYILESQRDIECMIEGRSTVTERQLRYSDAEIGSKLELLEGVLTDRGASLKAGDIFEVVKKKTDEDGICLKFELLFINAYNEKGTCWVTSEKKYWKLLDKQHADKIPLSNHSYW